MESGPFCGRPTMPDRIDQITAHWRGVLATAAAGAILTAILVPLQVALFIAVPPPASHSVGAWFDLFNESPVIGLLSLDLLMMVEQVLAVPIILALFLLVHRAAASATLLGAAAWMMGAILFLGSNTGFEMLALARGYAAAGPADQAAYVAAGHGMLASYWDMGTSFVFGYVLSAVGGILLGAALIRAGSLGRAAGWLLVVANVVGLGIFLPGVGVALSLVSVLLLWVWYVRFGWSVARMVRRVEPQAETVTKPVVAPV
jgi:hypothetical protein